uniref:Zn(2)-C6 fungal-type domain-containing protein n=1 Tax=Mycena chlorophos TaxID=658473 RepID=A0ABQ0KV36_MYCCL|nr:predicted protein [Mycena chlorophos]
MSSSAPSGSKSPEETPDAPIPNSKKRRLQNACDICRSKKIRCDSARMPNNVCSNCISFGSSCTHYQSAASSNKRTSTKQAPQKAEDKLRTPIQKQIAAILSTTSPYALPEDSAAALRVLIDVAAYAKSLEQEVAVLKEAVLPDLPIVDPSTSYTRPPTPTELSLSATDGCVLTDLNERMKGLMVDSSHNRFYGQSSDVMLLKTAMDIKRESGEDKSMAEHLIALKRPEYWLAKPWHEPPDEPPDLYVFPEADLLHSLMGLYWFHCHPFIPLLHRATFEKAVADRLHLRNSRFGATVLLVCALASRYSNDPRVILHGTNSELSCGWKWAGQIRLVRQSFTTTPSLYDVQICVLAVVFLQGTGCPELCWVLTSIGIRLAQDVGAHRRRRYDGDKPAEDQLWTRAFWVLVCIDILLSAAFGRPRATTAEDFDLDLPIECDDVYWDHPEEPFKQPDGVPSVLAYFIAYIKLLDILGFAQRTLYTLKRSKKRGKEAEQWNQQVVAELDSAMNNWIDSLPEHLKWDPHRENFIFFQQSASLYASYYHVQIQIHRPFIPVPGRSSPLSYPSLAVCANSARSCAHVMDVQARRGILPLAHVKMALFDSSVILLLIIWSGKKNGVVVDTTKEIGDVHTCLNIIKSFERRWQIAGRLWDTLYAMLSAGDLLVEPVPPSLKRDRDFESPGPMGSPAASSSTTSGSDAAGYPHTPVGGSFSPREHIAQPIVPPIPVQPATMLPVHSSELGRLPAPQWQFEIANPLMTSAGLGSYLGPDSGFAEQGYQEEQGWAKVLPSDYFPSLVDDALGSAGHGAPQWTYQAAAQSDWTEWDGQFTENLRDFDPDLSQGFPGEPDFDPFLAQAPRKSPKKLSKIAEKSSRRLVGHLAGSSGVLVRISLVVVDAQAFFMILLDDESGPASKLLPSTYPTLRPPEPAAGRSSLSLPDYETSQAQQHGSAPSISSIRKSKLPFPNRFDSKFWRGTFFALAIYVFLSVVIGIPIIVTRIAAQHKGYSPPNPQSLFLSDSNAAAPFLSGNSQVMEASSTQCDVWDSTGFSNGLYTATVRRILPPYGLFSVRSNATDEVVPRSGGNNNLTVGINDDPTEVNVVMDMTLSTSTIELQQAAHFCFSPMGEMRGYSVYMPQNLAFHDYLAFDVRVLFPQSPLTVLPMPTDFVTYLPMFMQAFSPLGQSVRLSSVNIAGAGVEIQCDDLQADKIAIRSSYAPIMGNFNVTQSLTLDNIEGYVLANVTLVNDPSTDLATYLVGDTGNNYLNANVTMVSTTATKTPYFNANLQTFNGSLDVNLVHAPTTPPASVMLTTSNSQGPTSISLDSKFAGGYDLRSKVAPVRVYYPHKNTPKGWTVVSDANTSSTARGWTGFGPQPSSPVMAQGLVTASSSLSPIALHLGT